MISLRWRVVAGPLLALATANVLLLLAHHGIYMAWPGAFLLASIFIASYLGGAGAGYLSVVIALGYALVLLPEPGEFASFAQDRTARWIFLLAFGLAVPVLVTRSQARARERLEHERATRERVEAANRELLVLRADLVRHAQELERLATTDDLTGLYNRRHFLALAEDERRLHERGHQPLALMLLDIDFFKSINDRFGHDVGDAMIRHVADICRDEMRGFDLLARIGGEEFVLLLPHTTSEQAMVLAERLRDRLETSPLVTHLGEVGVTASIGVAATDAQVEHIADLMKRADQALYQAKRDGRNRVRLARALPHPIRNAATVAA